MASRTPHVNLNDKEWKTSSIFSASLDLVLTFLFLLSACISIFTSKLIKFFGLDSPCYQTDFDSAATYTISKTSNKLEILPCNHHANKTAFNTTGQSVHLHNLCEDCLLLDYYFDDRFSENVVPGTITKTTSVSEISIDENNLQPPSFQRLRTNLKDAEVEETGNCLKEKTGSELRNAECSSLAESDSQQIMSRRQCCFYRKGLGKNRIGNLFLEGIKPTNASIRSFHDVFSTESEHRVAHTQAKADSNDSMSNDNSKINLADEKRSLYERHLEDTTLQEGEHLARSTPRGEKLSKEIREARSGEICRDAYKTNNKLDEIEKCDSISEANTSLERDQGRNLTVLSGEDAKHEILNTKRGSENEVQDLRNAIQAQRRAFSALSEELEEERNASAIAASETLAMIARIREEKAAMEMESRQFKRIAEERAAFDHEAAAFLQEILSKREGENSALRNEADLCRRRLVDDRLRLSRRQRLKNEEKNEESENCYEEGRKSFEKRSEKLEARKQILNGDKSERNQEFQDYFRDSSGMSIVDTAPNAFRNRNLNAIDTSNGERTMKLRKITDTWIFRLQMLEDDRIVMKQILEFLKSRHKGQTVDNEAHRLQNTDGLLMKLDNFENLQEEPYADIEDVDSMRKKRRLRNESSCLLGS